MSEASNARFQTKSVPVEDFSVSQISLGPFSNCSCQNNEHQSFIISSNLYPVKLGNLFATYCPERIQEY